MTTFSPQQRANAIRVLSMDAVQAANSGHPGMPMGMADIAEVLWHQHLKHNPNDPNWINRDRFVLSNGHGSMLLYSLLHLTGYAVSLDDLKQFRQLHSNTPGHPELGYTPGVETTTGPLGQGLANAVGFALAESILSAEFNRPGHDIIDHHTYCFVGDGCLMEGISHEVASLAGTWALDKLIVFYDDNGISIDGDVQDWFTDDTQRRFESYQWHVIPDVDGHCPSQIDDAIKQAKASNKPTLICCKTTIGLGSPNKAGSHDCHGAPLGTEEIAKTKASLAFENTPFALPDGLADDWNAVQAGIAQQQAWEARFSDYQHQFPELASQLLRRNNGELPTHWQEIKADFIATVASDNSKIASRKASENAINALVPHLPELLGGSADLAPSNLTKWKSARAYSSNEKNGHYLHYGVREFGMAAIANGALAHGGFRCFTATFLMFMEYARNAVRMASLMKLPAIYVFTHDSIGLGEDGPTHQPIEQIANLRATPNLDTWRPCDATETAVAWCCAIEQDTRPSALCLSRQGLPALSRNASQIGNIEKGGYLLQGGNTVPDIILISSGSEVSLAVAIADAITAERGLRVNVVSMPCHSRFDQQSDTYKQSVLPNACRMRFAIEAGATQSWYKYVGIDGEVFGIDQFGESAPANELYTLFGLTEQSIKARILRHF